MTNNEAIRTLKANYPDACFEQLREAVDMAINALTAQPEKTQLSEEDATSDCISRKAAIDAINERQRKLIYCFGFENDVVKIMDIAKSIITALPSAQPDLSEYSDKLWKAAYERGKAEAQAEIVRCKDCKHYKFADNRAFGFPVKRCEWTGFEDVDNDDFCSRAERITDDR